ncbi:hypothetical protein BDV98DRAFT_567506 [Pterulicium gracile]|uniref:Secreted protein n=1 Tax=Pterulicium gracile TaxID=1884261 RepID=A0A5C3QK82_9AGAR|nr:hypothetical protein BDV98DRAFT_567506 [Pterula gracilis]
MGKHCGNCCPSSLLCCAFFASCGLISFASSGGGEGPTIREARCCGCCCGKSYQDNFDEKAFDLEAAKVLSGAPSQSTLIGRQPGTSSGMTVFSRTGDAS